MTGWSPFLLRTSCNSRRPCGTADCFPYWGPPCPPSRSAAPSTLDESPSFMNIGPRPAPLNSQSPLPPTPFLLRPAHVLTTLPPIPRDGHGPPPRPLSSFLLSPYIPHPLFSILSVLSPPRSDTASHPLTSPPQCLLPSDGESPGQLSSRARPFLYPPEYFKGTMVPPGHRGNPPPPINHTNVLATP